MPIETSTISLQLAGTIKKLFSDLIKQIDPNAKIYDNEPVPGNDKGNGNYWHLEWLELGTPGFESNESLATLDLTYFRSDGNFRKFAEESDKFNQYTGWVQNAARVKFNVLDLENGYDDAPIIGKGYILIEPGQGGWVKMQDEQNPTRNVCWTRNIRFAYGQNLNTNT